MYNVLFLVILISICIIYNDYNLRSSQCKLTNSVIPSDKPAHLSNDILHILPIV